MSLNPDERMLCMLMLLKLPRTRIVYVTSQPVSEEIIDYYLHLLPGIPATHARQRLTLFSCFDSTPKPLAAKIQGKNGEPKALNLSNAHIGNLADAKYAWPIQGQLYLNGFRFDHLGGFAGETGPEMRARGMEWWDNWARLDPKCSPAPYAQLAAALTSAGDRDAANEIRYLGRVRERETEMGLAYIQSGIFQYVAGFGIGTYTFRVLWWVILISCLGAPI